jgi:hypothetical protein
MIKFQYTEFILLLLFRKGIGVPLKQGSVLMGKNEGMFGSVINQLLNELDFPWAN